MDRRKHKKNKCELANVSNNPNKYYERHFTQPKLISEKKDSIAQPAELIKSPVVAEFLGLKQDVHYSESELESAIIEHLQEFIMD